MKKPWWEGLPFSAIGYDSASYSFGWSGYGLSMDALKTGKTVFESNNNSGTLKKTKEELLQAVKDLGGAMVISTRGSRGLTDEAYGIVWPDGALNLYLEDDNNIDWDVRSTDKEFFDSFLVTMKKFVGPKDSAGRVYVLSSSEFGMRLRSVGVAGIPYQPDNYNKSVQDAVAHIVEDLQSPTPCGRVNIMDGIPGSGKSYLIRSLIKEIKNAMFVLIPSNMINDLANPLFAQVLIENKNKRTDDIPMVLIVEDADRCLSTRAADNIDSISALLNFSDGIMGSLLDLRIVCTTNVRLEQIDEAIMRPGRLCTHVHVDKLTFENAKAVYTRLTGKEFEEEDGDYTLAEIYRFAKRGKLDSSAKTNKKPAGFFLK